jgi:PucR C-terminal helix-turn-helix domain
MVADQPWEALPPEVAAVLRPELPALADEIIAEISVGVPDYARPLEGPFGLALRTGVVEALRQFVAMIEDPEGRGAGREVYVNLGRGEMRAGRKLDALLAAYRVGARVAWRRLAAAGERAGLSPRTLYALAESIFAYIDELSAESIEGYAREQTAAAGALQLRRQHLAGLLVQQPPAAATAIEAAASEAGWTLPRTLAALAVEAEDGAGGAGDEQADRLAVRLGPDALVARVPPVVAALVPDPAAPGRRRELAAALRERPAALGPTVRWPDAALSFARAREVLRLAREGAIQEESGLLVAEQHNLSLLLGADRRLARDVADHALAPLDGETELSRDRLRTTLEAWLRHRGRTETVARALHVHPQTVRYRLARLRELFGARLDDPDGRFELELALRSRTLAGTE